MEADPQLDERAEAILRECSTMTLATSGREGPWAADVFFAPHGSSLLVFISSPNSRHVRDSLDAPAAAATVHFDAGSNWQAIRGLQIEGHVGPIPDDRLTAAREAYFRKFPFAAALLSPDSAVQSKTAGTRVYALHVRRMFLVDNRLGFGVRHEVLMDRIRLDPT
jgi:uncharacterized protein YhbP (UPF0306 family)